MITWLVVGAAAAAVAALFAGWRSYERRWARRTVEDFARRFPGGCAVCAFDRWAVLHGIAPLPPTAHPCPELHASAPKGMQCVDCLIDGRPCWDCQRAFKLSASTAERRGDGQ